MELYEMLERQGDARAAAELDRVLAAAAELDRVLAAAAEDVTGGYGEQRPY